MSISETITNDPLTQKDHIELINQFDTMKLELIDQINKSRKELIVWIVSVGLLHTVLSILVEKFL